MAEKCFVVMGFEEKPDIATGRTLDLDKTYRMIIKKAVLDAALERIRADEVIHAGIIDEPMYELLRGADVVMADLSTSNANAIYELGVRHALRPHTTIVIAEKRFKFPFDIGHLLVRPYEHLGKGIDGEEAARMRLELTQAMKALMSKRETDSPVYTFLAGLQGPSMLELGVAAAATSAGALHEAAAATLENAEGLMELFHEARGRRGLAGGRQIPAQAARAATKGSLFAAATGLGHLQGQEAGSRKRPVRGPPDSSATRPRRHDRRRDAWPVGCGAQAASAV